MKYVYLIAVFFLSIPHSVFAQLQYDNPLVAIPGYDGEAGGVESFINLVYGVSISIAALLAVIKIVIAGAKWMLSGDNSGRITSAKNDIQGALIGLIIIISAVLIITTINPTIVGGG